MLNAAVQPALLSAVSCCTAITHSPVYRYQACIIDKARQAVVSAIILIATISISATPCHVCFCSCNRSVRTMAVAKLVFCMSQVAALHEKPLELALRTRGQATVTLRQQLQALDSKDISQQQLQQLFDTYRGSLHLDDIEFRVEV